uniref:Peptide synthetase n=1 Tax=Aureobasidium pullulans TaxID=5580 RepID=O94116_AURPU|nr:peptide synthetase [Aureobasidium pullulans]
MPARTISVDEKILEMDETLSILNPLPTLLEGPELLHELISGPETSGTALEYLDADGKTITLSYLDLHRRSEHLAWRLIEVSRHISRKDLGIVPIYIPQCISLYISQLAILKSGAAFCPLNLDVPGERLKFILKDTSASILLTTAAMRPKLPELEGITVIVVDDELSEFKSDREPAGEKITSPDTSSLAYIMYTSGSTGLPKAVCLSHRAVTQSLLAHDRFIPSFSRFLQFASPTFDVSVFEIFFPWYRGATLVSVERNRLLGDLPGTITSLNIDAAELTPSVAASLVRHRENVPTLRALLTIGEMLNTQVIQQFGGSIGKSGILYGMYGPTEAAIHCTLQPGFGVDLPAGTIGIPLDTVSCFIVKPTESTKHASQLEILPIGEIGELVIGGHQLADGYLNREEQTRAAFVTHPKFGGLYRTGDKARLHRNGTLECYGRISSGQVKLRGQRVELGEIEHAASKAGGCHAVIASVISGLLVLFCIGDPHRVSSKDIKSACQKWLPAYMIPSDIVLLDDFPYLPSGKVDKKRLETDYNSNTAQHVSGSSDLSENAREITRIIESVLGVSIDHSTDLSAAGLDSLRAIQVASQLRRQGCADLGALELLSVSNVLALDELVRAKADESNINDNDSEKWKQTVHELRSSVERDFESKAFVSGIEDVLPCTPLQDAMLVETAKRPQAYCNELRLTVSPKIPVERVRQALFALAQRHTALRSGFMPSGVSHCAYTQVIWKTLVTSQFAHVKSFTTGWSVTNRETLLRPLHFQYKCSGAEAEILVAIHHALYDQWSVEVILEDLETLLQNERTPERPSFGAVNKFFNLRRSEDQTSHLDFWGEYLSDVTPGRLPNLSPKMMPPQPLQSIQHTIEMDMETLRQAAHSYSCSAHVFFQAAYAILLGFYMGTEDTVFGTVFSGRTLPIVEIESMVGPLLSTLPTRINTLESRKFSDVLSRLQEDNRKIMRHSMTSLADIKKACGFNPGEAVFDSIFVWQETARPDARAQTLLNLVEAHDYLEFNLTLELEPTQQGVKTKATYQSSLLPLQHVKTLLQQLDALVKIVVARPETHMNEISDQLPISVLSVANSEPQSFVYKAGLGSLVENHALNNSGGLALVFAHDIREGTSRMESLTYGELNTRANQLANYLISQGAKRDELICVCMEKSVSLYLSILAAVKAGCGYLPLVPETPAARIRQILAEADVKFCLTDSSMAPVIADVSRCHIMNVDTTDCSAQSCTGPQLDFKPTDIAYAVFTSGTTGKPKGVLVTQENILSNLEVLSKIYPVPEGSRLLQACNQAFDVSVFEIFFTWYTGMCLCSASKDVMFRDFEKAINELEITHLSLTPTVAALTDPAHIPRVKFLVTAGEAVTHHVHGAWAGKGLYQGYGPSETTNICTVNSAVESDHVINNIGPAFENTSAFVLTQGDDFQLVPLGGLGELCFGGQQVFRGYQNMPELTESKIINHPNYGRIYRSGDLGRLLPDGTILIQGRTDDQRKIRGQRIELGEISGCLLQFPSVQNCAIEVIKTADKERLMAFWIPSGYSKDSYSILQPDKNLEEIIKSIYAHLADNLPAYMVPDALVPVSAIPQTSQGKIDKRRLASDGSALTVEDLNAYSRGADDDETSELSATEQQLASALADTLQMSQTSIGRSTSFFALGLDSVSAIRLATNLRKEYGYSIDVSQILKRPTIARLAPLLGGESSKQTNEPVTADCEAAVGSYLHDESVVSQLHEHGQTVSQVLPCTPLQEAMLSARDTSGSSAYRNKTLFSLHGSVDKLKACWEVMLQRHDILRTIFLSTEDSRFPFVQAVLSQWTLPWQECDDIPDQLSTLLDSAKAGGDSIVDHSPPWKIQVYRSESTVYLLLDMHHALYDANAMSNLLYEVEQLYKDQSLSAPVSFKPFLNFMISTSVEEADALFRDQLREFVPKPFKRTDVKSGFGTITGRLNYSPKMVETFLSKHSTTMLSLTQAMWMKTLAASQSYSDVCCGNVVSGRSVPVDGIESLVAPCFNTIPVRVDLSKHRSNLGLVKALQRVNIDSLPYQLTPLRRIQAQAGTNGKRLFDSLVLLQQDTTDLDSAIWRLEGESGVMDFPCIVELAPTNESYTLSLHFNRSYLDDEVVSNLHQACLSAFASCIRYPSSDVSDFIDFDADLVAGVLKPDTKHMQPVEAAKTNRSEKSGSSGDESWSPLELQIRAAYSAVSSAPEDRIRRDTTIYKLGLDSISAIQLANRLRKDGLLVQASDVMESPSCSELASAVQSRSQTPVLDERGFDFEGFDKHYRGAALQSHRIATEKVASVRPCTPLQSGMLSEYTHSDGHQYFNHTFYAIEADIDSSKLQSAWSKVLEQHELLRTGFVGTDDHEHPFVMLTYTEFDVIDLEIQASSREGSVYEYSEQKASESVKNNLHLPPWRWSLLGVEGRQCLQFSAHHAIFDAESLRLIMTDLQSALSNGYVPTRLTIDGALGHILSNSQADVESQRTFWSQKLSGAPVTRFPNMTPVRISDTEAANVELVLNYKRSKLEARCQELGVSMQSVGQAAWARLLSAYTGESQVTFGVVLSGRTSPATADAAFPCITTLPVSTNTAVDDSQFLKDLMSYNATIQKHQFTPLTNIRNYAESTSEALFDSLFVYQRPMNDVVDSSSWKIIREKASVELAVSVEMEALSEDGLGLRLTIDPAQVPHEQGKIMLQQMEVMIAGLLKFEDAINTSVMSIIPPKDPIIATDFKYLHEMTEASVKSYSDRIAMEFVDALEDGQISSRHWTYRQLDEEANKIAHLLIDRGVKPGDIIATSFDKCPEASFAFYGILKAGCAFCAIDPTAPAARKAFILEDSNARVLLTSDSIRSELRELTQCDIIDLINFENKNELSTSSVPVSGLAPSSVSYVLYTSGTTGTPKGCEITHDNAVQLVMSFKRLFKGRWTDESRWLQFASYHFDVSVLEQFWTWIVGMRLVCAPRDLILEDIAGFLDTMQITHLDLTPSLGRLLDPALVPSLHKGVFITGGESLKQDQINTWGDVGCLFNFYGPTECTIGVTVFPCVPKEGKPSNIGWQFDNVGCYVLAPGTQTPVLRGAIGELCISGKLVGKGYLNRPELTADCFPYLDAFGERVYRTGDLVRLFHDGSIDFLGRKDNQVKLRGQRLEIDEIEAVIKRCQDIQDTVCIVAKHPKQDKDQLIAFIGINESRKQGKPELCPAESTRHLIQTARAACEERLPGYMVPTHFLPIQRIPLSVNNKVEEKLLRQLYADLPTTVIQTYATQADSQQSLSDGEQKVAQALAELLKIDDNDLTPSSNIFSLGLSSISAIQFSKKLKASGFTTVQVATVLKNPTISRLTKALATSTGRSGGEIADAKQVISACRQRHMGTVTRVLRCKADDIEAIAPCTPLQQGIISRSLASESSLYFNSFKFNAQGVDLQKLEGAFNQALERTQILRTFFIETDDGYVQAVRKTGHLPWWTLEVYDLASVDGVFAKRKQKWRSYNTSHLTVPFEIVIVRSGSETFVSVDLHHALYDGNSFDILMNNVSKLYNSQEADFGKPFVDCLAFGPLRNVQGAKQFWLDHLPDVKSASMPPLIDNPASHDVLCTASLDILNQADELRRSLGVTVQALVQATWVATLRKHYQGAIGTVVSGRSIDFDGVENVIGPLFNTIPFYLRCEPGDTWQTLVQRCHDFNTTALPYQHTPLRDIVKWCNKGHSRPLFDALFVYQGTLDNSDTNHSILKPLEDDSFEADYPLSFEAEEAAGGNLKISVAAKASICNETKARELIDEFHQAFLAMNKSPENEVGASIGHTFERLARTEDGTKREIQARDTSDFHWGSEASVIRSEIATLAGVQEADIDERTSIFEVGLDSVDAVKLSSRLKKKGVALPVSTIMRSQTIAQMVLTLTNGKTDTSKAKSKGAFEALESKLTSYARDQINGDKSFERVLPASPMQEALVSEMVRTSYKAYFNHDVLKLSKELDIVRLEQAWRTVIKVSPILRTGFLEIDDPDLNATFAQIIQKAGFADFDHIKLSSEDAINEHLAHINSNVSSAALFQPQLRLTRVSTPEDNYLVLSVAHALYDGHSLSLLHQDVQNAYNETFQSRPFYADILRDTFHGSNEESVMFWRSFLTDAKKTQLPQIKDNEGSVTTTHRTEKTSRLAANDLSSFCKQQGVTLQAACQTAWAFVLAHTVQSLDVMFGVVLAGRDSELAEQVMFPMMNTVIMRSVLHGSRKDVMQSIQATISDISNHQHFPLRQIQAACQGQVQSTGQNDAFFDSLFTFQRRPDTTESKTQMLYESVNGASEVEYPVAVEAEIVDGSLIWRIAGKSSAFDEEGVRNILDTLEDVLQAIVTQPHEPTLAFDNQEVSICDLPAFQQQEKTGASQTAGVSDEIVEDEEHWSDTESAVREAIAKVTKTPVQEISKTASIQNLGVDSINAIKISALLRQKIIRVTVSEIVRAGSVWKIASVAQNKQKDKKHQAKFDAADKVIVDLMAQKGFTPDKFGYEDQHIEQILPATAGQVYMLGAWQTTNGQLFFGQFEYVTAVTTTMDDIKQAWQKVTASNAVLRTVFVATQDNETPVLQLVLRDAPTSFVDLDNEETPASIIGQPFVRLTAQKVDDTYKLCLKIHHALYDAISLSLLSQELGNYLQDSATTQQSPVKFADFIAQPLGTVDKTAKPFWVDYLQGVQYPQLESDTSSPARHIEVYDPRAMSDMPSFENNLRKQGLSLQSVFFAAYARAYSYNTDPTAEDVIIGIYLANRSHLEDLSSLAAPTLNLVPLRVRSPTRTSLAELAKRIQRDLQAISTPENSSVGLWEIEAWTGVTVDTFVNFVKVPDNDDDTAAKQAVVMDEKAEEHRTEKRSHVSDLAGDDFVVPKELQHEVLKKTYKVSDWSDPTSANMLTNLLQRSLDVEATVADGALGIGVFGWEDMMDIEQAEGLIEELKIEIQGVLE